MHKENAMKKPLTILAVLALALMIYSCGDDTNNAVNGNSGVENVQARATFGDSGAPRDGAADVWSQYILD